MVIGLRRAAARSWHRPGPVVRSVLTGAGQLELDLAAAVLVVDEHAHGVPARAVDVDRAGGGLDNGGQSVRAPSFHLTQFRKIACEKAQGKPGFVCDHVAGMGTDMRHLPPSMRVILGNGQVTQARFVRQAGGWIMLSAD